MPEFTIPNSLGAPMEEANDCHSPAGSPAGGQFCGRRGDITSTPEFKRWFRGSKVVDKEGNPLRVYHSTNAPDIEKFREFSHFGTAQASNDRAETLLNFSANVVHRDPGHFNTLPVYIRMTHPLRMPDLAGIDHDTGDPLPDDWDDGGPSSEDIHYPRGWEGEEAIGTTLLEMGIIDIDEFEEHGRDNTEVLRYLRDVKGYDGIVYRNVVEDPGYDSYIIFSPKQVKSAIGNRGAFSKTSPKIREAALREFNRCHRPGGSPAGGQFSTKNACAAFITPGEVKHERHEDWGGVKSEKYYVLGRNRTNSPWFPTEGRRITYDKDGFMSHESVDASLLRGKPLTPEELEALPGRMLYHVTTNLEGVLESGALLARKPTNGSPGLGGGQYPAVSFTSSAEDARNIFMVMSHAQRVAKGEDLRAVLTEWAKKEGVTFGPETARSLLGAVDEAVKWYDFSMRDAASALVGAELSPGGETAQQDAHRQSLARDAFNNYINRRGSLKVGHDPILFTSFEALAKAGTVAIVALPQRGLRTQTKRVAINSGADKFQQEIEVHGDVPIAGGFYFTGANRVRRGPRWTPHISRIRRKAKT